VGPGGSWKQRESLFPGVFETHTNLSGRGMGGPWARWGWFELCPHQGVNKPTHILQSERRLREREERAA
jgi:hypothetical protein